jgi:tyrosine aminotransferase
VLTSGCSHALQMAIEVLCNPGDTLFIPNPGFPLYHTIADHLGVATVEYALHEDAGWEADLDALEAAVAAAPRPRALLINNPSNPCGSVYTEAHLRALLAIAGRWRIPVIADEIYADMVFEPGAFHPLAALTDEVPVLSAGGISKRYLVPGWRLGWLACHDKGGVLQRGGVLSAVKQLTQIIVGPNSLMQAALPSILQQTSPRFYDQTMSTLARHAAFTVETLGAVAGLRPVEPQGAMYVMVGIDEALCGGDDVVFAQRLLEEESVFVLPGQCFGRTGFFRIVTCPPEDKLGEAYARIAAFCNRNRVHDPS